MTVLLSNAPRIAKKRYRAKPRGLGARLKTLFNRIIRSTGVFSFLYPIIAFSVGAFLSNHPIQLKPWALRTPKGHVNIKAVDSGTVLELEIAATKLKADFKKTALKFLFKNLNQEIFGRRYLSNEFKDFIKSRARKAFNPHWIIPLELGGAAVTSNLVLLTQTDSASRKESIDAQLRRHRHGLPKTIRIQQPRYSAPLHQEEGQLHLPLLNDAGIVVSIPLPLDQIRPDAWERFGFWNLAKPPAPPKTRMKTASGCSPDFNDCGQAIHHRNRVEEQKREYSRIVGDAARERPPAKKRRKERPRTEEYV